MTGGCRKGAFPVHELVKPAQVLINCSGNLTDFSTLESTGNTNLALSRLDSGKPVGQGFHRSQDAL